jgi:hypothetical protein
LAERSQKSKSFQCLISFEGYLPLSGGQVAILCPSHRLGHGVDAGHAFRADTRSPPLPSASSRSTFPPAARSSTSRRICGRRPSKPAAVRGAMPAHAPPTLPPSAWPGTIGRMARGTPNSATAQRARPAASPIAWRREDRRSGSRRAAGARARNNRHVMFCQPYNVVTRWRSVSLGLYSCNGAALRIVSAYR